MQSYTKERRCVLWEQHQTSLPGTGHQRRFSSVSFGGPATVQPAVNNTQPAKVPVRLGLAGLGRVGLRHALNITRGLPAISLKKIQDRDESVARAQSSALDGLAWTTSYNELVNDPEI